MDNLLEYIIPLIFAGIYFFGNMLSKGGDKDESDKPRRPMKPIEDPEAVERQRRIQEEIRRKIMERRNASQGAPVQTERPLPERREEPSPVYREPEPTPVVEKPVTQLPVEETSVKHSEAGNFSWDESDNAYEKVMQQRMQEIEATNQQAAKLKREAEQANRSSGAKSRGKRVTSTGSGLLTGSVKQTLKNPAAARAAFIYGEVLGQPVSLQKGSTIPGLK